MRLHGAHDVFMGRIHSRGKLTAFGNGITDGVGSYLAGNLTCGVAAHAIRDNPQPLLRILEVTVFIVIPDSSRMSHEVAC